MVVIQLNFHTFTNIDAPKRRTGSEPHSAREYLIKCFTNKYPDKIFHVQREYA